MANGERTCLSPDKATRDISRLFFIFFRCSLPLALLVTFFIRAEIGAVESTPPEKPILPQNFHRWGSVTLFNGLPSDVIRVIAQSPDGVLWFGTDNGLARFDGRRVQTLMMPAGAARITAIHITRNTEIIIGTESGAYIIENNKVKPIAGLESEQIAAIAGSEKTWIAAADGDIYMFENGEGKKAAAKRTGTVPQKLAATRQQAEKTAVKTLLSFSDFLYFGTGGAGTYRFLAERAGTTDAAKHFPRPFFVNAMAADGEGNIWVGTKGGNGLYRLRVDTSPEAFLPGLSEGAVGEVMSIAIDADGGIWAGTSRNGLWHFRGKDASEHFTFQNTSGNLRSNTVNSVLIDAEGVVWVGTNRGVSRFDPSSPLHQILSDDAQGNFARTLFLHRSSGGEEKVFAGTNRGLFALENGRWQPQPGFKNVRVYAIGESANGELIVGTPAGLLNSKGKKLLEGDFRGAASLGGKTLAALFGVGLVRVDEPADKENSIISDENEAKAQPVFLNPAITTLSEKNSARNGTENDSIFIGTANRGVFKFDGNSAKQVVPPESIGSGAVWRIVSSASAGIDSDDLWIAAESGLFHFTDGIAEPIVTGEVIRDVLVNESGIWAASLESGLIHIKINETFGRLIKNIGTEHGLPSDKVFAVFPRGEELLIGTNRGISVYRPGKEQPGILPFRILSRRLHDAEELAAPIELEHPQNSLLVEVAGLSSRTFPEEFQYGFILRNGAGEISEQRLSGEAQFAPVGLAPGAYTIEVRAFSRDLVGSRPLAIRFLVGKAPFPWTSAALAALLLVAVIALIWAIMERWRIVQKNQQLAAAKFDLANEAERERRRIARDLHDQTLADLRSLMMKSDRLQPNDGGLRADFRREIEAISTDIRRICEDLSPSVLENVGLIAALEFLFTHSAKQFSFSADDDAEDAINFPMNVQLQVYRIAQEVMTNIMKHSGAGSVNTRVTISEGKFRLKICDDGLPFKPRTAISHGRGIANIRARASLIQAEVKWATDGVTGNCFLLEKSLEDEIDREGTGKQFERAESAR